MRCEVITLLSTAKIIEAVETFEEYKIGGAPVVDGAGNLIGVLTASDLARKEHLVEGRLATARSEYYLADPLDDEEFSGEDYATDYNPDTLGPETVQDWMTPTLITVGSEATLKEVCKLMVAESIHRLLVVDEGKLVGIVTTFDVVRHVASTS